MNDHEEQGRRKNLPRSDRLQARDVSPLHFEAKGKHAQLRVVCSLVPSTCAVKESNPCYSAKVLNLQLFINS